MNGIATQSQQGASGPIIVGGAARELSYGCTGEDVKRLQSLLNAGLSPSPLLLVDGKFGYKTELAVLRFQTGANLVADGIVGPKTWAALSKGDGKSKPVPVISHSVSTAHQGVELIRRGGHLVPHFWQSDPKWGRCSVGGGQSLACIGCAVTSIAMVLRYYGRNVDPGKLNEWLSRNSGYAGSSVIWSAAFRAFSNEGQQLALHDQMYMDRRNFRSILYKRIAKGVPTIVDIDYGRDADTIGNHYVVIVGRHTDGSLIMNDPAAASGDGARNFRDPQNTVERTSRAGGYKIVSLCLANPA